ncbi:hypothetical protein DL767_003366 [Monosporascus sp. MG133]|nr:hypothetical protein DL767_003366 [Monosporascus sp. MG133]
MASQLPTFPRIVFTIIEPISLISGALGAFIDTDWFITSQASTSISTSSPIQAYDINARVVAQQLGNTYFLLCLLGVAVLWTTSELRVVRNYLLAAWVADISHVWLTCRALGWVRSVDVTAWNAMTWGNVGFTTFLFLTRTAWFLGVFGPDHPAAAAEVEGSVAETKKKA